MTKAEVQASKEKAEKLQKQLDQFATELEKTRTEAKHAAEMASRDAELGRQTMQYAIDRLTKQLTESKAHNMALEKWGKSLKPSRHPRSMKPRRAAMLSRRNYR